MKAFIVLTLITLGFSLEFLIPLLMKCWKRLARGRAQASRQEEAQ